MPSYDPRIDAYIAKSAGFTQPVLQHLRELIHEVCPAVEETMKWSMPHFEYYGLMCGFAAFTRHCSFGFWKAALLADPHGVLHAAGETSMGSFGKITGLRDLPSDIILKALIRDAMRLNEQDIGVAPTERASRVKRPPLPEPGYFTERLAQHPPAKATWDGFPPSHRREYLEWITGAKTEPTREKRLAQTIQQLAEGKRRDWKYVRR